MRIYETSYTVPFSQTKAACVWCLSRLPKHATVLYVTKPKIPARFYLVFCSSDHAHEHMNNNDLSVWFDKLVLATKRPDDKLDKRYEEADPKAARKMLPYLIKDTEVDG